MAYRILSFCGGGVRGLMSATILRRLDHAFRTKHGVGLADQADMIAGTSTGSLITGLLLIHIPPHVIVDFYLDEMVPLFSKAARDPNAPALPPDPFISVLDKYHLDLPLSLIPKNALFTSFDIGGGGVPWSPLLIHNFAGAPTAEMGLLDAMSASGAMPGMTSPFPYVLDGNQLNLVDGAFVHHDPTVPAIALAAAYGQDVASMSAIDIGTGFMHNFISANASGWGANQWINGTGASDGTLPPLLVNTPAQNSQMPFLNLCLNGTSTSLMPDLAGMLLGNGERFAYLNPDFGDRYVPEDASDEKDIEFLYHEAEKCDLTQALAVLDAYWVD